jgi:hypothetical protein
VLCLEALQSLFVEAFENAKLATMFNTETFDTIDDALASINAHGRIHDTGAPGEPSD